MTLYQMICHLTASCASDVKVLDQHGREAKFWWVERKRGVIVSAVKPCHDAEELK